MFIVRITGPDVSDWKGFERRSDAVRRFTVVRKAIYDDDLEEVRAIVFHVPNEADVRRAIERVKAGDADIVEKSWITLSADGEAEAQRILEEVLRG